MLSLFLALSSSSVNISARTGLFFRAGELPVPSSTRKSFGAYFPNDTTFNLPATATSRVSFPPECTFTVVSSRLSVNLNISTRQGPEVCIWLVVTSATVSFATSPMVPFLGAIVDGEPAETEKLNGGAPLHVRDNILLKFNFTTSGSVQVSSAPTEKRGLLPDLQTHFVMDDEIHWFVNEGAPPRPERATPPDAWDPGNEEWGEEAGGVCFTGLTIVFAILVCCLGLCCYKCAKRRQTRREGMELEAIPPVFPANYQPVGAPYGYQPQCPGPQQAVQAQYPGQQQQPVQVQYPRPQQPVRPQYLAPQQQVEYPGQQQAQYPGPQQQPVRQPQVPRGPGIVYGH